MEHDTSQERKLVGLPLLVATPIDVGRLIRELEVIDNNMLETTLRGERPVAPHISQLMAQSLEMNQLNVLEEADRKLLMQLLTTVREKAPVLHISFSADPNPQFTEKLMAWLRREIHPLVIITVGLQPNIGAGCMIRTTNKYFDLSLKQDFQNKRDMLLEQLRAAAQAAPAEQANAAPAEVAA